VLTLLGVRKDIEAAAKFVGYADRATSIPDVAFMGIGVVSWPCWSPGSQQSTATRYFRFFCSACCSSAF